MTEMASIALLTTKLLIPAPCPNLVPRPQLLLRLSDGLKLGHKLTLLSASAGFGKTNLLSEWAASPDVSKSVAWLSLDMEDNSPTRFWMYVVAALQNKLEEVGETAAALLRSIDTPSTEAILTPLLNEIAAQSKRVVLILDDYHRISKNISTYLKDLLLIQRRGENKAFFSPDFRFCFTLIRNTFLLCFKYVNSILPQLIRPERSFGFGFIKYAPSPMRKSFLIELDVLSPNFEALGWA